MLAILVVVPFVLAAIVSALAVHEYRIHKYVALAASASSLAMAVLLNINPPGSQSIQWFSVGRLSIYLSTITSPMHLLLLTLVSIVSPLIILYSIGFMRTPSEQRRFYFELSVFTCAIMLFAIGGDLITLFIAWELMGLTSYLLIGFWSHRDAAVSAARKTIIIMLVGDLLVFASIVLIWSQLHTFSLQYILQNGYYYNAVKLALFLMILGAFTKSAQFPFHEWLADAMEGPTPVSAFLHSSTMVKAGVFLIALLLPLVFHYGLVYLLLAFGIATAAIGALNAVSETHIKRILAYSTMEDIGLMFVALGLNSIIAAMTLFAVQTFYKALLFMDAGSIMSANGGEENINKLAGPTGRPALLLPTIIGAASLAGIFPLSGFFGKMAVESAATGIYVYTALILVSLLSSVYMFRWLLVPLRPHKEKANSARRPGPGYGPNYNSTTKSMYLAMYILVALVLAASALYLYLPIYLGIGGLQQAPGYAAALVDMGVAFAGVLIAYILYYRWFALGSKVRSAFSKAAYTGRYVNKAYLALASSTFWLAGIASEFDRYSYLAVKEGGAGVRKIGALMERMENGSLNYYLFAFVLGAIAVILVIFVI